MLDLRLGQMQFLGLFPLFHLFTYQIEFYLKKKYEIWGGKKMYKMECKVEED